MYLFVYTLYDIFKIKMQTYFHVGQLFDFVFVHEQIVGDIIFLILWIQFSLVAPVNPYK
jgi:hypothetical protein